MTRRLEPINRVKELGDASVPFEFDVHGMIYSENAPELEGELHRRFNDRRVNLVNLRKEFFKVTLAEIQSVIAELGLQIELTLGVQAREYAKRWRSADRGPRWSLGFSRSRSRRSAMLRMKFQNRRRFGTG